MHKSAKLLVLAALFVPALALAASWWNNDWKYRKEIGFDLTPGGRRYRRTLRRMCPFWCACRSPISAISTTPSPTASDFRLLAGDDKTPLKFHFEKYDPQNQMAFLWVQCAADHRRLEERKDLRLLRQRGCAVGGRRARHLRCRRRYWCCRFGEPPVRRSDLTAYKNDPSSLDRGADAGVADRRRREVLRQGDHHRSGDVLAAIAAQSGAHRLGLGAHRTAAAGRGVGAHRQGKESTWRSTARKFVARAAFGGAPVTVTQTGRFRFEPVASRCGHGGRRQAHAVRRWAGGGQRAGRPCRKSAACSRSVPPPAGGF